MVLNKENKGGNAAVTIASSNNKQSTRFCLAPARAFAARLTRGRRTRRGGSSKVGSTAVGVTTAIATTTGAASKAKAEEVAATTVTPKPPNEVLAGGLARAGAQATIHPIDTIKVRMQISTKTTPAGSVSATPRMSGAPSAVLARTVAGARTLYKGCASAASGAGLAIGTYFFFYNQTKRYFVNNAPDTNTGTVAFVAGAVGAIGSSVVKVPAAVCIRSVQAGVYPNGLAAATRIMRAAGPRGLFTGYWPTLLEDVPDMAVKFAMYEVMGQAFCKVTGKNRSEANVLEDLAMGGIAGSFAAAATTPVDIIKTRMMCNASSRPTVFSAARAIHAEGSMRAWFTGVGPRAISNGINSAVFFMFFEGLRAYLERQEAKKAIEEANSIGYAPRIESASLTVALESRKN